MSVHTVRSLTEQFDASVNLVRALPQTGSMQTSYEDAAKVYAYYKQAKFGECIIPKPSFWDPVGRAKWVAWASLKNMTKEEAMQNYVNFIKEMFDKFQQTDEYQEKHRDYAHVIVPFYNAFSKPAFSSNTSCSKQPESPDKAEPITINGSADSRQLETGKLCSNTENKEKDVAVSDLNLMPKIPRKPVVRINGVHELNANYEDHVALSHSIIENILRSGEKELNSPSNDVIQDSDKISLHDTSSVNVNKKGANFNGIANINDSESSDDEVYCDSLGELPDCLVNGKDGSTNGLDHDLEHSSKVASKVFKISNTCDDLVNSDPHSEVNETLKQREVFEKCAEEKESNTDLSSLSSGSGCEQALSTMSVCTANGDHETCISGDDFPEVKSKDETSNAPSTKVDELAFLNDCKKCACRFHPRHKEVVKRRAECNHRDNDKVIQADSQQENVSHAKALSPCPGIVCSKSDIPSHLSLTNLNHGSNRKLNGSSRHEDRHQHTRSFSGSGGRYQNFDAREDRRARRLDNQSSRSRETSSSSESDGNDTETIGEKILHCLERLQEDVQGIKDRLTSIEKGITTFSERPAPWWYKYLPSKTVACLFLWPLLLNVMLLYVRKRKRK